MSNPTDKASVAAKYWLNENSPDSMMCGFSSVCEEGYGPIAFFASFDRAKAYFDTLSPAQGDGMRDLLDRGADLYAAFYSDAKTPQQLEAVKGYVEASNSYYSNRDRMRDALVKELREPVGFDRLSNDVGWATGGGHTFSPDYHKGHQLAGINFNSLGRIVDKHRREVIAAIASHPDRQPTDEILGKFHGQLYQLSKDAETAGDHRFATIVSYIHDMFCPVRWELNGDEGDTRALILKPDYIPDRQPGMTDEQRNAVIEECAQIVETTQETISESPKGSKRHLTPRTHNNLMGLAFAEGIRNLKRASQGER